jgi:hypothetical protein
VRQNHLAANSVGSLPPCGGGVGRGVVVVCASYVHQLRPPPLTPPHKGEGNRPSASRDPHRCKAKTLHSHEVPLLPQRPASLLQGSPGDAAVAQRQSNRFVSDRLTVRIRPAAPQILPQNQLFNGNEIIYHLLRGAALVRPIGIVDPRSTSSITSATSGKSISRCMGAKIHLKMRRDQSVQHSAKVPRSTNHRRRRAAISDSPAGQ